AEQESAEEARWVRHRVMNLRPAVLLALLMPVRIVKLLQLRCCFVPQIIGNDPQRGSMAHNMLIARDCNSLYATLGVANAAGRSPQPLTNVLAVGENPPHHHRMPGFVFVPVTFVDTEPGKLAGDPRNRPSHDCEPSEDLNDPALGLIVDSN